MAAVLTWSQVEEIQGTLGAFIEAKGLDSRNEDDNRRLFELGGMSDEGFDAYTREAIGDASETVEGILNNVDPEVGIALLISAIVSTGISGVLAGAAATRQLLDNHKGES